MPALPINTPEQSFKPVYALPLPEDGLLQLKDVLQYIKVGKSTWWKWVGSGIAPQPSRKIGAVTFWRASDIRAFIMDEGEAS